MTVLIQAASLAAALAYANSLTTDPQAEHRVYRRQVRRLMTGSHVYVIKLFLEKRTTQ